MKIFVILLSLFLISSSLCAQADTDKEYMNKWEEYKKQEAPFNQCQQHEIFLVDIENPKQKLQLGDLKYKKTEYSLGHDILEVALWTAVVVKELTSENNSIHYDPASHFAVGYREKNY